jgi:biopolymer transport protein ExbD
MQQLLSQSLIGQNEGVIVLRADKSVPVQYIVTVIDAVNQMNDLLKTKHKVILATKPKE